METRTQRRSRISLVLVVRFHVILLELTIRSGPRPLDLITNPPDRAIFFSYAIFQRAENSRREREPRLKSLRFRDTPR